MEETSIVEGPLSPSAVPSLQDQHVDRSVNPVREQVRDIGRLRSDHVAPPIRATESIGGTGTQT